MVSLRVHETSTGSQMQTAPQDSKRRCKVHVASVLCAEPVGRECYKSDLAGWTVEKSIVDLHADVSGRAKLSKVQSS